MTKYPQLAKTSRTDLAAFVAMLKSWQAIVSPPRKRTPDEWADAERVLPKGSAKPGPFRSSRTPYMIPLQRAALPTAVGSGTSNPSQNHSGVSAVQTSAPTLSAFR